MRKILLGMTIWGEHHLNMWEQYCLPSLLAEGNLPALAKERNILINIHTDKASFSRIFGKIPYNVRIMVDVDDGEKYAQIGHHQTQDLREAKKLGADYHLLMPDFVYSENCFAGVLAAAKKGHKAIVRLVVSTVAETILPELDRPRTAIDLATLAFMNRHPGIKNWFVTGTGYPGTHVMAWVGIDTIRMSSPHCSPVYIANEAIHLTDSNMPLDCILDKAISGDIYCPKPEDGIVIIEVSPEAGRKPQYECVDLKEFCRIFRWDTKDSPKQLAIFKEETVDAVHPQDSFWEDKDIEGIRKLVYDTLSNKEK